MSNAIEDGGGVTSGCTQSNADGLVAATLKSEGDFYLGDGLTPGDRIDATGYRYRAYGENIYAGRRAAQFRCWRASKEAQKIRVRSPTSLATRK